jgi:hypothetical protein
MGYSYDDCEAEFTPDQPNELNSLILFFVVLFIQTQIFTLRQVELMFVAEDDFPYSLLFHFLFVHLIHLHIIDIQRRIFNRADTNTDITTKRKHIKRDQAGVC